MTMVLTRFDPISEETCSRQRHRHRQGCGNEDDDEDEEEDEEDEEDDDKRDDDDDDADTCNRRRRPPRQLQSPLSAPFHDHRSSTFPFLLLFFFLASSFLDHRSDLSFLITYPRFFFPSFDFPSIIIAFT